LAASLALAACLAGCGGGNDSSKVSAVCRDQADKVAAHASSMLLHYRGGTVYPADMSYLGLRDSLRRFERAGCEPSSLGTTLRRSLTPKQRATLFALLPRPTAKRLREAVAQGLP
jgi:hypothetical protein